jgi:hypothetical protein
MLKVSDIVPLKWHGQRDFLLKNLPPFFPITLTKYGKGFEFSLRIQGNRLIRISVPLKILMSCLFKAVTIDIPFYKISPSHSGQSS